MVISVSWPHAHGSHLHRCSRRRHCCTHGNIRGAWSFDIDAYLQIGHGHDSGRPVSRLFEVVIDRDKRVYKCWLLDNWQIGAAGTRGRQLSLHSEEINRVKPASSGGGFDVGYVLSRLLVKDSSCLLPLSLLSHT